MITVGYQGNHGTFSETAALEFFSGKDISAKGYPNFVKIMEDLEKHILDYGVLPVENTTTGIIARTYDLFKYYHIHIIGEVLVPIREHLIALPGTKEEEISRVYSHPEALSQCQKFFASHPSVHAVPYQDTAASVEYVKASGSHENAALGSRRAAEYYGMEILQKNVNDSLTNMTRFLVITWHDEEHADADKTSLMLVCRHEPGSLYKVLSVLAAAGINIVKLESRPIPGRLFEYLFYIDIIGNEKDPHVSQALEKMKAHCVELRSFGSYKAAPLPSLS